MKSSEAGDRLLGLPGERLLIRRVVPIERPITGFDRALRLGLALGHVDAVRDAGRIGQDDRRALVRFGFADGGQRLLAVGSHRKSTRRRHCRSSCT